MNKITAYTNGSALNNGNPDSGCGWACKLVYRSAEKLKTGCGIGKTNNQMEMIAVLNAMRVIKRKDTAVEVFSVSRYVVDVLNGVCKVSENVDLWELLFVERAKFQKIKFVWLKRSGEDEHSIEVDRAAANAVRKLSGRAVLQKV